MLRLSWVICFCFATFPLWTESSPRPSPKYEVATITDVQDHSDNSSDTVSYDVSVRVGKTIYVVLYKPPLGVDTVKYAAGRELLVQVNKDRITYNDILGQSLEVPILSQRPATQQAK
jgi:hypothetical protein